ncbi:MAG: hypothetical protein ABL921_02840 [Pirellula sp.]
MGKNGILLIEQIDGWTLCSAAPNGPTETVDACEPNAIALSVRAFAKERSLNSHKVLIAVATESVLFATIPATQAVGIRSNDSLRFLLEGFLPIDAESVVADEIELQGSSNATKAAIAMEIDTIRPIIHALEQSQCKVQSIVPITLLALEQALADRSLTAPSASVWTSDVTASPRNVEIVVLNADRSMGAWQVSEQDPASITRNLELLAADSLPRFEFQSVVSLAQKRAETLLAGRANPCVDLRRNELASADPWRRNRAAITRLVIAACILAATVCGTLLWYGAAYQRRSDFLVARQQELFRTAFPDQRVPAAILSRIRSEHAKVMGVRKTNAATAAPKSSLVALRQILESLGTEFPFEIEEIRIETHRVALDVKLLSQQDAGRFAASLASKGFTVEPPATSLVQGDRVRASLSAWLDTPMPSPTGTLRGDQ